MTTAVTLGTIGFFVISMAAGLGSWPFGAVGAAMLTIAVALLTTASMRGAEKAFVAGTVHVVKVSDAPTSEYGRCEMQVLVDAPGHPGQTVTIRDPRVPVSKWPDVGETLPALVAVSDARRVRIQWERVGERSDRYPEPDPFDVLYDRFPDEPLVNPMRDTTAFPTLADDYIGLADEDPEDSLIGAAPGPSNSMPLPRRTPSRLHETEHPEDLVSIAVLEGELLTPEVPAPRASADDEVIHDDSPIDLIDFSMDLPEPAAPTRVTEPRLTELHTPSPLADAHILDEPLVETKPFARPASAGTIHGVGITVLVANLSRSTAFYRDMLGFYEIDGGPGNVVLASGDTRVVLRSAHEVAPVNRRLVHLNLEVGDVEAVYEELKIRGVRFTYGPRVVNRGERLELWAAAFKDPDGHGIAITQWKARTD